MALPTKPQRATRAKQNDEASSQLAGHQLLVRFYCF